MLVEFIIPTYNREWPLLSMVASLLAQTNKDWKATIIQDGTDSQFAFNMANDFRDKRISVFATAERYNDFGHTLRQIAKQQSTADYVILTGDDNYYMPTMVEELQNAVVKKPGIVYWDMVHSHYNYQYFKCSPAYNQIDMGAFATRTDLAKQVRLNTTFAADGEFIEDLKKKFPFENLVKINKVLFVHN